MGLPLPDYVLVVDDDPDIRVTICELLQEAGYEVVTAANGVEALEVLRKDPRPCLMLLDLMMPVMDGEEVLATIHADASLPRVDTVVFTAAKDPEGVPAEVPVVNKPIDLDHLMQIVTEHCVTAGA